MNYPSIMQPTELSLKSAYMNLDEVLEDVPGADIRSIRVLVKTLRTHSEWSFAFITRHDDSPRMKMSSARIKNITSCRVQSHHSVPGAITSYLLGAKTLLSASIKNTAFCQEQKHCFLPGAKTSLSVRSRKIVSCQEQLHKPWVRSQLYTRPSMASLPTCRLSASITFHCAPHS